MKKDTPPQEREEGSQRDESGRITRPEGLYLRHGRRDLSRQPAAAGRQGVCQLAERKRQAVSVPDELV